MNETEFNAAAEEALARVERALDDCDPAPDYELKPGGVIEVEFDDGTKLIINRHTAAREIWVAAKSGGFHFRLAGGRWIGTRDGVELFEALSRLVSEGMGTPVVMG